MAVNSALYAPTIEDICDSHLTILNAVGVLPITMRRRCCHAGLILSIFSPQV